MKAKKVLMGYAALLIVFFHFYIPVFKTPLESFIYRSSYIGVDIFFLVSAYSLGRRDKIEFLPFIKNRLKSVYLPFVILTLIAFFYRKWPIKRLLLILCGGEFIKNGGGSFLWFAPGIMFFYLLAPFLAAMKKKFGLKAFAGMICAWFILCLSLQYGLKYNKAFILLNRLPVFFAGMYYDDISLKRTGKFRLPADIIVLAAGLFIIWKTGITRLNKPFADMYYVIAIPLVLAVTDIFELISEKINIVPLAFIGTVTFELYGLQMIFGYDIESRILKASGNAVLSFAGVTVILIVMAVLFNRIMKFITSKIFKTKELTQK